MPRYSKCTGCGGKTDLWFGTAGMKFGPCCANESGRKLLFIGQDMTYEEWMKKFRPGQPIAQSGNDLEKS